MKILPALLGLGFLLLSMASSPARADLLRECPGYAASPIHKKTMDYFAYRLKEQVEEHGCEAIAVYTAFGTESGIILELAENKPEFMADLADILADKPGLAEMLHARPHITQALDLRLREDESRQQFWEILKSFEQPQMNALMQGRPEIAALTLLLPNSSPRYLAANFNKSQLELLPGLVEMTGLASTMAEVEGMEELLPYFTTNPADALGIYKEVLETWGANTLRPLLYNSQGGNAALVSAMVPPLTFEELKGLNPLTNQPGRFHKMQQDYIKLIHDIYVQTAQQHDQAWGAEMAVAFADLLPLALLGADAEAAPKIRRLLFDLGNSELFARLLKPSACFTESNLYWLGRLLGWLTACNQELSNKTQGLAALAEWHNDGTLMPLIQHWLPYTSPQNFSLGIKKFLEEPDEEQDPDSARDAAFWTCLVRLALFRSELLPDQHKVFDELTLNMMRPNMHPAANLSFLLSVSKPLFRVIQPGKFNQPYAVAERLLLTGYPESAAPTLYELYFQNPEQFMNKAESAIAHRGMLPEGELLLHGQTFADRHGGWSVGDMLDVAEIGGTIVFAVVTWGAGTPALVAAASRIGAKQAARLAAKVVSRTLVKGVRMMPRAVRPLVIKGTKLAFTGLKAYLAPGTGAKTATGKVVEKVTYVSDAYLEFKKLYEFLMPESAASKLPLAPPMELCPEKTEQD